jgi:hypothetical protein
VVGSDWPKRALRNTRQRWGRPAAAGSLTTLREQPALPSKEDRGTNASRLSRTLDWITISLSTKGVPRPATCRQRRKA